MIQHGDLYVMRAIVAAVVLATLGMVEGQFMAHRIELNKSGSVQKLLKHIMELDLPIMPQPQLPVQNREINRRDMGTSMKEEEEGEDSMAANHVIGSRVVDSGENECNPNSNKFNFDGYDCTCISLANGKVLCSKQQRSTSEISQNNQAVFTMFNNFEKLVAQLKSRGRKLHDN